jgi:Mg2+ and Co2+ transporter CorA
MAQNEHTLQIVEFANETLRLLDAAPAAVPDGGFVWMAVERPDFDVQLPHIQAAAERLGGSMLLDVHLQDLASDVQPTVYDATSIYDLMVFRRLATSDEITYASGHPEDEPAPNFAAELTRTFRRIDSRAVGFAVFDKLLISVHPPACLTATSYVQRFLADIKLNVNAAADAASAAGVVAAVRARVPQSPADLVLRLINSMVDSYLSLRKDLSQTMERAQTELLKAIPAPSIWNALILARHHLQMLQDLCEEQQDAMQEWHDTLRDQPLSAYGATSGTAQGQRDQLISCARDVMEHIDRVVHHARRLEQTAETGMQIHFSTQNQRINAVMQTLTAVTVIFLPLNFFTGFFGMNFEHLPLIHSAAGMWLTLVVMFGIAWGLLIYFLRRRYLEK